MVWENHNSTYLASNLKGTPLWIASGNGLPGPLDPSLVPDPSNPEQEISNAASVAAAGATEGKIWDMTKSFVKALDAAGIPHTDYFYGDGTHSWPYWQRDLTDFLSWLRPASAIRSPRRARSPTGRRTRASRPGAGAFAVADSATSPSFSTSTRRRAGTASTRSGAASSTSAPPPSYRPGALYAVDSGGAQQLIGADASGRLSFTVDLGPSHEVQQYRFGQAATLGWQKTAVTINPA